MTKGWGILDITYRMFSAKQYLHALSSIVILLLEPYFSLMLVLKA
jgi:hypothetical protein